MFHLLRNSEVSRMLTVLGVIGLAGLAAAAFISWTAVAVVVSVAVLFLATVLFFAKRHYREVDKLSQYLSQVVKGEYSLDIRDNAEGELSVLKNEIYKVTVMLQEQAAALRQEKVTMANALSDISHQLKTPLTSMFVMTDLLCGDLPEEKRMEFTGKLHAQLERLQWLVSSLLKLSKLDAGTVKFKRERVAASSLLEAACAPLLIPMELKELSLRVDCPDLDLVCDSNWTIEALVNILKNCVEHTPQGGEIRISCTANPLYTEITIQDNGPGIAAADLPYIFQRFYKGRNAEDDSVGIGLAMAKSIITGQEGSIDVRSSAEGSSFLVRFFR